VGRASADEVGGLPGARMKSTSRASCYTGDRSRETTTGHATCSTGPDWPVSRRDAGGSIPMASLQRPWGGSSGRSAAADDLDGGAGQDTAVQTHVRLGDAHAHRLDGRVMLKERCGDSLGHRLGQSQ